MNNEITETVLYLIFLLLPGYVTLWVIVHNSLSSDENITNSRYIFWSVIDITLLSPLYILVSNLFQTNNLAYWFFSFIISFAGGMAVGYVVSLSKKKGWFKSMYKIDDCPTAWDKVFFNLKSDSVFLIETTDGRCIASRWNELSFVSKHGADIYLSNYVILYNNQIDSAVDKKRKYLNRGIWVNGNNISRIAISRGDDDDR